MGFLQPFNLFYLLSIAALVLIYLRARSRPMIDVSSLLLFEERVAPVARSRVLRVDLLFWLEVLTLSALSLTLAGLYLKTFTPPLRHRLHALVFDLGAGMDAHEGGSTRLDAAKGEALKIVDRAAEGDEFTVVGYALEAHVRQAQSARREALRDSIEKLSATAVAARPAALRAALMNVRDASTIDLFTDHAPAPGVLDDVNLSGRVSVRAVGTPAANLAIVSLDPGALRTGNGHCVVQNFSARSQQCELAIDLDGREILHSSLVIEPHAQAVVPFGPLAKGGVVHARIVTPDALAADNDRYAYEPANTAARVLVLSPDAEVRDDLARVLLAINENFVVTAADPKGLHSSGKLAEEAAKPFKLAVMHDCYDAVISADSRLIIFPEPWLKTPGAWAGLGVIGTVRLSEMQERAGAGTLKEPLVLGSVRVIALPGWMDALARGTSAGGHEPFPLAAIGHDAQGRLGVIAFDIRDHLLLNPDKLDALLLTIDTVNRLVAPKKLKIVSTGSYVRIGVSGKARIIAPGGAVSTLGADRWGTIRFRPLQAGRYRIESPGGTVEVLANYFDAVESNLSLAAPSVHPSRAASAQSAPAPGAARAGTRPLGLPLIALGLIFMVAESALLARRAMRWGLRHV